MKSIVPCHRLGFRCAILVVILSSAPLLGAGDGYFAWDDEGVLITNTKYVGTGQSVTDGDGGIFFVYHDIYEPVPTLTAKLRATRIDYKGDCVLSHCLVRLSSSALLETDHYDFATVANGSAGIIVALHGKSQGDWKILAQRIDADGSRPWGDQGIALSTALQPFDETELLICPDQLGGALVSWGSRVVQVLEDGRVSPGLDGIQFVPGGHKLLALISDGTGWSLPLPEPGYQRASGLFGAWQDANGDILVKRIQAGIAWDPPVKVTQYQTLLGLEMALAERGCPVVVSAGIDGGVHRVHAQKLDAKGSLLWGPTGVTIVDSVLTPGAKDFPVVTDDGAGGAIIAWNDQRNGNMDVYAQHIDKSSTAQWSPTGIYVSTQWPPGEAPALATQRNPRIASDQVGGALIVYEDNGGWGFDISGTRLHQNGSVIWSQRIKSDGTDSADPGHSQQGPEIVFDRSGPDPKGAIITWYEFTKGGRHYAQKVIVDDAPPENDAAANAKVISDGQNMIHRNLFRASNDGSASKGQPGMPDVWFEYTAAQNGTLKVNTCGTHDLGGEDNGMDSVLSIHTACPGTVNNEIACNDDAKDGCGGKDAGIKRDSAVEVPLNAGQTVYIRVSMYTEHIPGHFMLTVALE